MSYKEELLHEITTSLEYANYQCLIFHNTCKGFWIMHKLSKNNNFENHGKIMMDCLKSLYHLWYGAMDKSYSAKYISA